MRRLIAAVAVTTLLIGTVAPAAHAGGPNDAARALASFAAFHQAMFSAFVAPLLFPPPVVVVRPEVVYRPVAPPPAVVYAAPGRGRIRRSCSTRTGGTSGCTGAIGTYGSRRYRHPPPPFAR